MGAASQALAGSRQRQATIVGSLPPTGRVDPALSRYGGAAREGESTSAYTRVVGEGRGVLIKGNQERIRRGYGDVIRRAGGRSNGSRGDN